METLSLCSAGRGLAGDSTRERHDCSDFQHKSPGDAVRDRVEPDKTRGRACSSKKDGDNPSHRGTVGLEWARAGVWRKGYF